MRPACSFIVALACVSLSLHCSNEPAISCSGTGFPPVGMAFQGRCRYRRVGRLAPLPTKTSIIGRVFDSKNRFRMQVLQNPQPLFHLRAALV
jgi:hypothetical protein